MHSGPCGGQGGTLCGHLGWALGSGSEKRGVHGARGPRTHGDELEPVRP